MSETAIVAIVGTGTTFMAALAGYWFQYRSGSRDRAAARDLARDQHEHAMEATRSNRAYEERKTVYRAVVSWAFNLIQSVDLTEPLITWAGHVRYRRSYSSAPSSGRGRENVLLQDIGIRMVYVSMSVG